MLKVIQNHTVNRRKINDNFGLHLEDWKRSLDLHLNCGVSVEKNTSIKQL